MNDEEKPTSRLGVNWAARWNERDIVGLCALYAPDCRSNDMADGTGFNGRAGIKGVYESTIKNFPDFRLRCDNSIGDGLRYAMEWTMWATVNGQKREVHGSSFGTTDRAGRIQERRDYWDTSHLFS